MTQRYKVGDVVQEGKIEADRATKWADGTTTYSYLIYVTPQTLGYYIVKPSPEPKWYDESELHAVIPEPKFKVWDMVYKIGGTGICQQIVSAEYRVGLLGGLCWRYNTRTNAGYREDELAAWVEPIPEPKFKVGDKVRLNSSVNVHTVKRVSYDIYRKAYYYELIGDWDRYSENELTLFVAPPKKKGCEHFRETEFVVIANNRTIVKNKFCPDCGKRIR